MLLNQMLKKLGSLISVIIICSLSIYSCKVHDGNSNVSKKDNNFINYVFPPEVDSVFSIYIRANNYENNKSRWYVKLGRESCDTNYIILHKYNFDIDKDIDCGERNKDKRISNILEFQLYRTNRFATFCHGKYKLPLVYDYDLEFVGYGRNEYPLTTTLVSGFVMYITFKDWNIIGVTINEGNVPSNIFFYLER